MTQSRPIGRLLLVLLLAAPLLISGCGRKANPGPPEGREAEFTYPRTYPDPASVVPGDEAREPELPAPAKSIFGREKTTVFGTQEIQ